MVFHVASMGMIRRMTREQHNVEHRIRRSPKSEQWILRKENKTQMPVVAASPCRVPKSVGAKWWRQKSSIYTEQNYVTVTYVYGITQCYLPPGSGDIPQNHNPPKQDKNKRKKNVA